jgi:hypothetical protein
MVDSQQGDDLVTIGCELVEGSITIEQFFAEHGLQQC